MPTIMTHALLPLAAGFALGQARLPMPVVVVGMALSMLPDADVIGFKLGIAYADIWGHRGASHSFAIAATIAGLFTALLRPPRWRLACTFLFFSMASHGLLDALTNGGLGAALLWPVSDHRYFAPVTPIRVSPIGVGFFSVRGLATMASELVWVWLPTLTTMLCGKAWLTRRSAA